MKFSSDLFAAVRARKRELVLEIVQQHPELARIRDEDGATALHYAAESGDREIVEILLDAGADINARDSQFNATPAGWAIEYLREHGALLGIEIEDARRAIASGDELLVRRYVERFPALRDAADRDGIPLRTHASNSNNREIARLFGVSAES